MAGLRAIRRLGEGLIPGGELRRLPGRNEHDNVVDALLSELDMHIKELERYYREKELEERRLRTGADYSWLISYNSKSYEMPQMERLELESLCYKVRWVLSVNNVDATRFEGCNIFVTDSKCFQMYAASLLKYTLCVCVCENVPIYTIRIEVTGRGR